VTFAAPIFTKFTITVCQDTETLYIEFHINQSRNMENRA